jgi:hypothetical protein
LFLVKNEGKIAIHFLIIFIFNEIISFFRDPSITVAVLRLLTAMSASPYFRYNGNDLGIANEFFELYITSISIHTSTSGLTGGYKKLLESSRKLKLPYNNNPLENIQRTVRRLIRANAGISALVQLLYYRKNLAFTVPIRLETIKVSDLL